MDAEVGEVLKQLEADGLADDTIIFYFSDHGGAVPGSKRFLFESGLRVPLIIRFPAKWQHLAPAASGSRVNRMVSFVDFPPTVLSLTGIPIPDHMQGMAFAGAATAKSRSYAFGNRGRMDERDDRSRTVRDERFRYTRNWMPYRPWGQHIDFLWRTPAVEAWHSRFRAGAATPAQSRFFETPKPGEELYDCLADPHNVQNLAYDPAYQATLVRLRAVLNEWMLSIHDTGLLPEAEMIRQASASGSTIHDWAHSQDYPVAVLLEAANLASTPTAEEIPKILGMAAHPDSGVRYWATTAFISLKDDSPQVRTVLSKLLKDDSPSVALAAAEALYHRGEREGIVATFRRGLTHSNESIRLQAASALAATDADFVRQFNDLIERRIAESNKRNYDARALRHLLQTISH
jgi:hypothetical protein